MFRKLDPRAANDGIAVHGSGKSESSESQLLVKGLISEAWKLTWQAIGTRLEAILAFITASQDGDIELNREDRVPRFWANSTSEGTDL